MQHLLKTVLLCALSAVILVSVVDSFKLKFGQQTDSNVTKVDDKCVLKGLRCPENYEEVKLDPKHTLLKVNKEKSSVKQVPDKPKLIAKQPILDKEEDKKTRILTSKKKLIVEKVKVIEPIVRLQSSVKIPHDDDEESDLDNDDESTNESDDDDDDDNEEEDDESDTDDEENEVDNKDDDDEEEEQDDDTDTDNENDEDDADEQTENENMSESEEEDQITSKEKTTIVDEIEENEVSTKVSDDEDDDDDSDDEDSDVEAFDEIIKPLITPIKSKRKQPVAKVEKVQPISAKKVEDEQRPTTGKVEKVTKLQKEKAKPVTKPVKQSAEKLKQSTKVKKKQTKPTDISKFLYSLPSFAPNYTKIENAECKLQGQIFTRQLKFFKLWTLKMLDSSAKITSGVLNGNVNQLGDFDQCIAINTKVKVDKKSMEIQGKYCLAHIDLESNIEELNIPVNLALSKNFVRSNYNDSGHFIPRFTTINWGLCLPSGCGPNEAEAIIQNAVKPYTTGITFNVNVDECIVKEDFNLSITSWIAMILFLLIIGLVVVTTFNDSTCFSLKRTLPILLQESNTNTEITCLHGIRAICTIMLYFAHKLIPLGNTPFTNRTDLTDLANSRWSSLFRGSLIYTDSFLLLSGVLSAYHMSTEMNNTGSLNWKRRLILRYFRLTPALAATVIFYAFVLDNLGGGPLWNSIITSNSELCQSGFWKNILYIQNFFPFEQMCCTQTHQLALDMQLSLLSPILIWFYHKKQFVGLMIFINLHILSLGVRYYFTLKYNLSLYIFHGVSLSQLYRTANKSYGQTLNRATPYLTGICLGIILQKSTKKTLPKIIALGGWLLAIFFGLWTIYMPSHMALRTYRYDALEAAQYAAFAPVAWSITLSWIIFYCFMETESILNRILSNHVMVYLSRISYSVYLVQFIVFFYNIGVLRTSREFDLLSSVNLMELVVVLIMSTIFALLFDIPMHQIKYLFTSKGNDEIVADEDVEVEEKSNRISEIIEETKEEILGNDESSDDDELIKQILELPVKDLKSLKQYL